MAAAYGFASTTQSFSVTRPQPAVDQRCCDSYHAFMNWFLWALLSAAFAGATAVLAKPGLEQVNPHLATAIRTTVVLIITWAIAMLFVPLQAVAEIPRRSWLFLILSGAATGLSWLCYFRALQMGDVSRVAPVDKLSVVFAIAFALIFLRERITLQQGLGMVLIVGGVLLVAWKKAPG